MLRGLDTAAAGMIAQQHRHDTVTNNISNLNTPGYKQTYALARSFPEMLLAITGVSAEQGGKVGRMNTGVFAEESLALQLQGDLTQTNRAADFAIVSDIQVPGVTFDLSGKAVQPNGDVIYQPQAYFTLQDHNGEVRYTRGGQFMADQDRYLTTYDGARVLGQNGQPQQLPAGVSVNELLLNEDRQLVLNDGTVVGSLLISRIDNPHQLVREGDGNFKLMGNANEAAPLAAQDQVEVRQGYIERSNVDPAQSMVELMTAMRAYEANQKVVQFFDRSLDKAVNEVGRV